MSIFVHVYVMGVSGDIECIVCPWVKPSNYSPKQKAVIFSASPNLSGGIMPYSIK